MSDFINNKPSKIILIRNWMGGTNVRQLLIRLLEESSYTLISPEVDAWNSGTDTDSSANKLLFQEKGIIYYFRRPDVFLNFLNNYNEKLGNTEVMVQLRNPYDLLISEYYGNALCHAAPRGKQKRWRLMRKDMISSGVFNYAYSRISELNEIYKRIFETVSGNLRFAKYEEMVCNPYSYVSNIVDFLELNDVDVGYYSNLIDVRGDAVEIKSMKRNRRPEEWPGPGRFRYEFNKHEQSKLEAKSADYNKYYGFLSHDDECLGAPPTKSVKISKVNMYMKYIIRFEIIERLKPFLRWAKSKAIGRSSGV